MCSVPGGDHEVDSLDGVLGERMLQAWKLRANALRKDQRCTPLPALPSLGVFGRV